MHLLCRHSRALAEATSATADLSRRLSNVAPSQQGNSHRPRTPVSSPSRSTHVKGASTHSSPQAQHPTNPVPPPSTTYERPHNPLPKVPDDIFATTPYKHLFKDLDLPPVSALAPGQSYIVEHNEEVPQVAKKGLFGLKKKQPSILRQTRYVYVGTPTSATSSNNPPPTAGMYSNPPPMSAASTNPPPTSAASTNPPPTSATNTNPFPTPAGTSEGTNTGFHPSSPPPASRSFFEEHDREREEIRFNQSTEYAPLLNHSPYSVSYERVRYPTATHLLEAMKFLPESDHNHGIAELIRTCEDTADVYHLSQEHVDAQNQNETGEMYLERVSVFSDFC
ncbi:hypothetical protein H0H87_007769 [Tephrocybe sp. NHM501043]|nr:hypothetical protein H0H87_007769 [Tephrocybe sp. NHM501043]